MPRITLNPMLDGISGRLKKTVFCKKSMSPKSKSLRQGYIKTYKSSVERSIRQQNNRKAFQIVTYKYSKLRKHPSSYQTWVSSANRLSVSYTVSVRSLFYSFYLAMWQGYGEGYWRPDDLILSGGTGDDSDFDLWTWENRFNIVWF